MLPVLEGALLLHRQLGSVLDESRRFKQTGSAQPSQERRGGQGVTGNPTGAVRRRWCVFEERLFPACEFFGFAGKAVDVDLEVCCLLLCQTF